MNCKNVFGKTKALEVYSTVFRGAINQTEISSRTHFEKHFDKLLFVMQWLQQNCDDVLLINKCLYRNEIRRNWILLVDKFQHRMSIIFRTGSFQPPNKQFTSYVLNTALCFLKKRKINSIHFFGIMFKQLLLYPTGPTHQLPVSTTTNRM